MVRETQKIATSLPRHTESMRAGRWLATWVCLLLVCLGARAGSHATLQTDAKRIGCDSIRGARDTGVYTVYLTLKVPAIRVYGSGEKFHQDTVTDDFRTMALEAIRVHFAAPSAPALPVYGFDNGTPVAAHPIVLGQVVFSLTPTGGLASLQLVQSSLSPAIDKSLTDAIQDAATANDLPLPREGGKAEVSRLYVSLGSGAEVPRAGVPLFKLRVPIWSGATYPTADPARPITSPSYPPGLLMLGFSGTFIMGFVIDEDGNVVPSTIALIHSDISRKPQDVPGWQVVSGQADLGDFVSAVLPSMRQAHYIPATIDGCPVKSYAETPFVFNLKK